MKKKLKLEEGHFNRPLTIDDVPRGSLLLQKMLDSIECGVVKRKGNLLVWMCKKCKWVVLSDQVPHRMDFCKCEKHPTGCDYEVDYLRYSGLPLSNFKQIAIIDLDKAKIKDVWTDAKTVVHEVKLK